MEEENRRETWEESVSRVKSMMLGKYPELSEDIEWAYGLMSNRKVLGSQRALQYAGRPVLKKNARLFNCWSSYADRLRVFQESFFILLCGGGIGASVQKHHVEELPKFDKDGKKKKTKKTFVIPDSIEGWADSLGVLLSSYMNEPIFPDYYGYDVEFNTSLIRAKGSYLSSSTGKAPGPEPLLRTLEKVRSLLNLLTKNGLKKLRPIDVIDIKCHVSDAVLSGGVRRSSSAFIFSPDDEEVAKCKIGNWQQDNPQRARANISALLLRKETPFRQFEELMQNTKEFGDPGFVWADDKEELFNPCQIKSSKLLTPNGIRQLKDVNVGDKIWSSEGWTTVTKKWSTGVNDVYSYRTTANCFYGTKNHRVLDHGQKIEVKDAECIDVLRGVTTLIIQHDTQDIMDGLVVGDGTVHDYFSGNIKTLIKNLTIKKIVNSYSVHTTLKMAELPKTYDRQIPDRFIYGNRNKVCGFLKGLYSANGSICGNRVTLKTTSFKLLEQVQLMLSSVGIKSYYTTNKSKNVKFDNGTYRCKQSYDLNISTDREMFANQIGFIQKYKDEKLRKIINNTKNSKHLERYHQIVETEHISTEETFDITVDNKSHTYWTQGCNVSNCFEIGMYAKDEEGNSGWGACNLSSVNCGSLKDEEDLYERCRAASFIGTLQAGFTDFGYLGKVTENIVKKEALIGVSLIGVMENPELCLDTTIQKNGAKVVKETNKHYAKKIGINQASRTTCSQPAGTSALILSTSAGVHPHHSPRYIRRVQNNATEAPFLFFKEHNPHACEKSVWGSGGTDENILFPIEIPDGSKTKNQLSAIAMLEIVKDIQTNWVNGGKNKSICVKPFLSHNVSNTITVDGGEWDEVTKYIYKNRNFFSGISLISTSGCKDFPQAPNVAVFTSREIIREYGDAALWSSGLIELALHAFSDENCSLWKACDALLTENFGKDLSKGIFDNGIKHEDLLSATNQVKFITKAKKFADKYIDGDLQCLTYCLKDVYNWKLYNDLIADFKPVDYTQMREETDETKLLEETSCAGGACLI